MLFVVSLLHFLELLLCDILFLFQTLSIHALVVLSIELVNLVVNCRELLYSSSASSTGLIIPMPPNLHGGDSSFLSSCEICESLNKAGMNLSLMTFSTGVKNCLMFLIVLIKNVNLCLYPAVNAAYAACGCVFAINDSCYFFTPLLSHAMRGVIPSAYIAIAVGSP